jgi:hypothetical protein
MNDLQTIPSTTANKNIPIEVLIDYSSKGLSYSEIGKLAGCDKTNVYHRFKTIGYDPEQAYSEWTSLTEELIDLKTRIHIANVGIVDKIFTLGELKNKAAKLHNISTQEGLVKDRYSDVTNEYVAYMGLFSRDAAIKELERQIESLQEEIEAYNALTKI